MVTFHLTTTQDFILQKL